MGISIEKYNILFSIVLQYYRAMDRFVVRKRTAEDDGNIEKCTKIQNKSNYYLFFIFIIYLYYIEYYHQFFSVCIICYYLYLTLNHKQ